MLEYFSSTHGARKGLADTALKTADSGYLTRKLADVAQNIVVSKQNCGTINGVSKSAVMKGDKVDVSLAQQIRGRVARDTIVDVVTDEVIVKEDQLITLDVARRIEALGYEKVRVRSPLTCEAGDGICGSCYGMDLSRGRRAELGLAIGIIGAQSIGEPGTQLTMRTFHIGGTASRALTESQIKGRPQGRTALPRRQAGREPGRPARLARPQRPVHRRRRQGPRTRPLRRAAGRDAAGGRRRQDQGRRTCWPSGTRTASRSSPTARAACASRTSSRARR